MNHQGKWDGADDLYRALVPSMNRLAFLLCGDAEFAEDAVHDAFLNVVAKLGAHASEDVVKPYLRRAVINQVRSGWRSMLRRYTRQGLYAAQQPQHADPIEPDDDPALTAALAGLSGRQRAVVVLTYYYDWDDARIAKELRCARGTVKSSRSRALTILRKELGHV